MAQPVNKILKALFDVKPVDETGRVDVARIEAISARLDLSKQRASLRNAKMPFVVRIRDSGSSTYNRYNSTKNKVPAYLEKLISQDELEKYLNSNLNIRRELRNIGGRTVLKRKIGKPRYCPIFVKQKSGMTNDQLPIANQIVYSAEAASAARTGQNPNDQTLKSDDYQTILSQINQKPAPSFEVELVGEPRRIYPFEYSDVKPSPSFAEGYERAQPEIESWIRYTKTRNTKHETRNILKTKHIYKLRLSRVCRFCTDFVGNLKHSALSLLNKRNLLAVGAIGFSAFVFNSFGQYGISIKNEVVRESNLAMSNLEQANESLRVFDFEAASNNFAEAYEEFAKAGDSLNFMGASITSLFAELPGFDKLTAGGAGKLKSAKNLVEAGKLLAEAGKSMSEAVSSLSETGDIFKLSTLTTPEVGHVDNFGDLRKLLTNSGKNLSKASALLAKVNADDLPEEKRESFSEFQSKLPELEEIVSDAVEYTAFLENLLGSNGIKKYLILFQNDSELRPTGGFPGTYAVVTFKDGRLAGFLVDDVYNLDGQMKENIIPPKPLQHITPNWGMRDANWFIDFSVSAQKIIEFYENITGKTCTDLACNGIDGVITMSPRMISDILKVVGPIEMPEYGYAINYENFLSTIQAEVEYGDNREQPKQVVKDMAPRLLEKIYSAEPGQWLDIFNVFVSGLDKKDILMYFKDLSLESFAAEKGFGGLVQKTDEDYLMVTFSNVKGSKTDRVTDNSISLNIKHETRNTKPVIIHKLTITRQHNGGSSRYGFYNRQNPAYVRVLVPEGSELLSISGNSDPGFKPLISYSGTDPVRDRARDMVASPFGTAGAAISNGTGFKQDDSLLKFESGFNFDGEKGVSTYKESGKTGFAFWLITDPGERKTVELDYAVPITDTACPLDTPCPRTIYIQKQPGLEVDNFEFQVGDAYIYNGKFDKDLELRFKVE